VRQDTRGRERVVNTDEGTAYQLSHIYDNLPLSVVTGEKGVVNTDEGIAYRLSHIYDNLMLSVVTGEPRCREYR